MSSIQAVRASHANGLHGPPAEGPGRPPADSDNHVDLARRGARNVGPLLRHHLRHRGEHLALGFEPVVQVVAV